jgi:pimeloyl-ACP methyl ester carboxylesterase
MTLTRLILAACLVTALGPVSPGAAQDRPVVFLHGLRSAPDAWQAASDRLQQRTMIVPHRPALDWRESFTRQAQALGPLASLPGQTTVVVGHSNGGIVAREWSRSRSLSGIVTLGTPHAGAPLVTNFAQWSSFAGATSSYVGRVMTAFSRPSPTSWVMNPVYTMLEWALGYARMAVVDGAAATAIGILYPVSSDMRPGSAYLASLNSSTNLTREASAAPRRAGIVSVANNYYWAGPVRAAAPEAADAVATALYGTIAGLDFWAAWVLANSSHGDPAAIEQAQSLFSLAAHLASIDPIYCAMVSSVPATQCLPNDGVLPHTSQRYPNALNIVLGTDGSWGPAHIRQTQQSDDTLYRVLVEVMQVPPRSQAPPPPPPPPVDTPPPAPGPGGGSEGRTDLMLPGDVLRPGEWVRSHDGRFDFVYQGDGNLVLYHQGAALWHSGTHGRSAGQVAMQHDGNFVMYDANNVPIWSSDSSYGHSGAWLIVQDDGNVVIYSEEGTPLWDTGTAR